MLWRVSFQNCVGNAPSTITSDAILMHWHEKTTFAVHTVYTLTVYTYAYSVQWSHVFSGEEHCAPYVIS